jgi:hypothetical protein
MHAPGKAHALETCRSLSCASSLCTSLALCKRDSSAADSCLCVELAECATSAKSCCSSENEWLRGGGGGGGGGLLRRNHGAPGLGAELLKPGDSAAGVVGPGK